MKLSVVLPAYKEEKSIVTQLERLEDFLGAENFDYELIVVVDGFQDNTYPTVQRYIDSGHSNVKLLGHSRNRGKGFSIRKGLRAASGDFIGYTDSDTDIQIETFRYALQEILRGNVDGVAPSKFHPLSEIETTPRRKIMTRGFQLISKTLLPAPKGVDDVSCGLKVFKREVIEDILPKLSVNRFAIDSEVFFWVKRFGYEVKMTPFFIKPDKNKRSHAANVKQILIMLKDIALLSVKVRLLALDDIGVPLAGRIYLQFDRGVQV